MISIFVQKTVALYTIGADRKSLRLKALSGSPLHKQLSERPPIDPEDCACTRPQSAIQRKSRVEPLIVMVGENVSLSASGPTYTLELFCFTFHLEMTQ